MLEPNHDYTKIKAFEFRTYQMSRAVITTPPETCTKGAGTSTNLLRFRQVGNRVMCQVIAWSDVEKTMSKWTNAGNAFVDVLAADVDQWDVTQFSDTQVLLVYQLTGQTRARHMLYSDGSGWGSSLLNGYDYTPPVKINAIPYFGHSEIILYLGSPTRYGYIAQDLASGYDNFILGDPAITRAYSFYSKIPLGMVLNASNELRIYYGLNYSIGAANYQYNMKFGRGAGSDLTYQMAGDTLFSTENGVISQGYNPFYMRTVYDFQEMPCAKHNGVFFTVNAVKYLLTNSLLGQIKEFSQDWKSFHCIVPYLSEPFVQHSTVFLRRVFTNTSFIDSNPMVVIDNHQNLFDHEFQCAKILDAPAFSPLLHHLAESQPHMIYQHNMPFCPVTVKGQSATIFGLLERYKLNMSHDLGYLQMQDNSAPLGTLTYDLYDEQVTPDLAVNILYQGEDKIQKTEQISGEQPVQYHNIGFLSSALTRKSLISDYSFANKVMTFEKVPQYFQVGDQITVDSDAGMISDIVEKFTINKWRQTIKVLLAPASYPPLTVGNVTVAAVASASSLTWTHTVQPGGNRLLVVSVTKRSYNAITGITFNGVALTFAGAVQQGSGNYPRSEMWYLVAPAIGPGSIVISLPGSDFFQAGAIDLRNVKQTTPTGTYASASGAATPATVTAVSAVNDLVLDCIAYAGTAATPAAGQTAQWAKSCDGNWQGAGSTKPGAASVVSTWTIPAGGWALSCLPIHWINS